MMEMMPEKDAISRSCKMALTMGFLSIGIVIGVIFLALFLHR